METIGNQRQRAKRAVPVYKFLYPDLTERQRGTFSFTFFLGRVVAYVVVERVWDHPTTLN